MGEWLKQAGKMFLLKEADPCPSGCKAVIEDTGKGYLKCPICGGKWKVKS